MTRQEFTSVPASKADQTSELSLSPAKCLACNVPPEPESYHYADRDITLHSYSKKLGSDTNKHTHGLNDQKDHRQSTAPCKSCVPKSVVLFFGDTLAMWLP